MGTDPQREIAATTPRLWVRLTKSCNNHCFFCHDTPAQDGSAVLETHIRSILDKGRRQKYVRVVLSGGEATLHPRFPDIVAYARKKGYQHIQIITNGRMFAYKDFLEAAVGSGLTEATFSIHGHTARLHDMQTRVPGSFEQALSGLRNALASQKLIVNMDIVINRTNVRYLDEILTFFCRIGIREFDLLHIVPFGEAWTSRQKVFYAPAKAMAHLRRAFQVGKKLGLYLWTNRFPPAYLEGHEDLIQHPHKLHDEVLGRRDMFDNFLRHGAVPSCKGPRCIYCFMRSFCADLKLLRKKGVLSPLSPAPCLAPRHKPLTAVKDYKTSCSGPCLDTMTDFYIKHRYFLKSLRCRSCRHDATCNGAPCQLIREKGFKILRPR
jgi:MoaA/NifB/PqqE/SkfB family radical SAM enzyme